MSTRWSRGAHVSEIGEAHFQIVFINKPQIWVLNNYILAWNKRDQCRPALAVVARGTSGVNTVLLTYREETKRPRRPIAGLPAAPWVLSSAGKLIRSDIYSCPTSCLIVPQAFSSFVFYLPSLSFCRSARLFTERSLLHIMSRHAPYCWLATSLFWYSALTLTLTLIEKLLTLPLIILFFCYVLFVIVLVFFLYLLDTYLFYHVALTFN